MNAAQAVLAEHMTEAALQSAVLDYARLTGWRAVHFLPAQDDRGRWRTFMAGDPGFPDTVLVRPGRLVVAELKSARGAVEPDQRAWLALLYTVGAPVEVYVWKPVDWLDGTIRRILDDRVGGARMRTPDVSRLTGATYRQLDYWDRQGYVTPSLRAAAGSGAQREYSPADIAAVARIMACLDAGLPIAAAVRVARGESDTRRRTGLGWPGEQDVWLSDRVRVSVTP